MPQRIVILTGSGISAESGLKTFRDQNGLWEDHHVEEVATPEAFRRNPQLVHRFYNLRRNQLAECEANAGHRAIAKLQNDDSLEVFLITQNVDDLHERAGSPQVLHMHGELKKIRCTICECICEYAGELSLESICASCLTKGHLRPHIVWFGEIPFGLDEIDIHLSQCDLFLSVGTSGQVYPAAGFVMQAKQNGAYCVELNKEPSSLSDIFDEHRFGLATEVVPFYFKEELGLKL